MNITINGDIYITNYGQTLDELTEGMEFDEFGEFDDCDCDYCDDCTFCDCDCEDGDFIDPLEVLIEEYAELLVDDCSCFDCIEEILEYFLVDVFNMLTE